MSQGLSLEANEQVLSVAREQQAEIDAEDRQATHYGPATAPAVRSFSLANPLISHASNAQSGFVVSLCFATLPVQDDFVSHP